MKDVPPQSSTQTEVKIVDAAIRCFLRFGARKTSMNDIARHAGVSRQTLYDLIGGKDELIRASVRQITDQSLATIRVHLEDCSTLDEKLNAYFQETVIKSFEMLQTAGDPEDLISGHNEAGAEAIRESHDRQNELVAKILAEHATDQASVKRLANFIVSVAMSFKYVKDRAELDELLGILMDSARALSKNRISAD